MATHDYEFQTSPVKPSAGVPISFFVNGVVALNLDKMARAAGQNRERYCGDFFMAAYSARFVQTGDRALDAMAHGAPIPARAQIAEKAKNPEPAKIDDKQISDLRAEILRIGQAVAERDSRLDDIARELEETKRAKIAAETKAEQAADDLIDVRQKVTDLTWKLAQAAIPVPAPNPDVPFPHTPQQEADSLSRAVVQSIKGQSSAGASQASLAKWAGVSIDAIKIILKVGRKAS